MKKQNLVRLQEDVLTCMRFPHLDLPLSPLVLKSNAAFLLAVVPPFSSELFSACLSEESLPNPMKPREVSPSLVLLPANLASLANL